MNCASIILIAGLALAQPPEDTGYGRPVQPESAWQRDAAPLLHNFGNMYQPCVREFPGEEYRYKMWFFGWASEDCNPGFSGCDAIYAARSKDLRQWEVWCGGDWDAEMEPARWVPVIAADDKPYDEWHNGDPSVVVKDGVYYMALSSTSRDFSRPVKGHPNKMLLCIMGATSSDGLRWTKTAQPLLIEPPEVQNPATDENWLGDYHRPSLLWDNNRWRLWFDYWHPTKGVCMGYAENEGAFDAPGAFRIKHDLMAAPMIPNWPNPEVIRIGGKYHSFADPCGYPPKMNDPDKGWTSRALCEAVSDDGLNWKVVGFIAPDPDAAALHVPQALVTRMDGREWLCLFYATQRGLRDNPALYDFRYDRIRAMRRPLP